MEEAFTKFKLLRGEFLALPPREHSEADTRADAVDRILREVLGWRPGQITRERSAGGDRYDYRLNATTTFAVVEAKRAGVTLTQTTSSVRWFKRSGPVCQAEPLNAALNQAEGYAQRFGCGLACVSTGQEWAILLTNRSDGRSKDECFVALFRSLDDLADPRAFQLFYELLSEPSVRSGQFRLPFLKQEGLPEPTLRAGRRLADQRGGRQKKRSELAKALEPVLREVFAGLSTAQNAAALRACFVETDQSKEANARLDRIARELTEDIQPLLTGDDQGGLHEVLRNEVTNLEADGIPSTTVLLLGQNGAGKSTFLDIFFHERLPAEIRKKCLVLKIDLARADPDPNSLPKYLRERTIEELEKALFEDGTPSHRELKGIFFKEYQAASKGPLAPLKERRPEEFEIEFGRQLARLREDSEKYLSRLLLNTRRSRGLLTCLIFDNADHFDDEFQRIAFLNAQWTAGLDRILLILALRDTTYWRAREQSSFHAIRNTTLFLPRPKLNEVLTKRFNFAVSSLRSEDGRPSTIQSLKGFRVRVQSAPELLLALQKAFTKTTHVSRTLTLLASGDIREALRLFEQCVSSPHLHLDALLSAYLAGGDYELKRAQFERAVMLGEWESFDQERNRRVVNLLCNPRAPDISPLLACRLLQRCYDLKGTEADGKDRGFVSVEGLMSYFQAFGVRREATDAGVGLLLAKGLLEPYNLGALPALFDPKSAGLVQDVRITGAGVQHRTWLESSKTYAVAMAEDVVLYEPSAQHVLRDLADARNQAMVRGDFKGGVEKAEREMVRLVRNSSLAQDAGLLTLPQREHTQRALTSLIAPWA